MESRHAIIINGILGEIEFVQVIFLQLHEAAQSKNTRLLAGGARLGFGSRVVKTEGPPTRIAGNKSLCDSERVENNGREGEWTGGNGRMTKGVILAQMM